MMQATGRNSSQATTICAADAVIAGCFVLATLAPTLLAFNLPPSPTLLNQCLAIALWGGCVSTVFLLGTTQRRGPYARIERDILALSVALAALVADLVATVIAGSLPSGLGLVSVGVVASAAMVSRLACAVQDGSSAGQRLFEYFALGILVAASASTALAAIQVFAPDWADGGLIAKSALVGRAVGNLRQPNHLSTLLLWGLIVLCASMASSRMGPLLGATLAVAMTLALVLTASRTGALGVMLLAAWGALDRRLSFKLRAALMAAPVLYAALWFLLSVWGHGSHHLFGGEARVSLGGNGDISSSRFAIWSNTLAMITREPLAGVGFGEFNLAWTLTEFPHRPTAFFDHTHNLPLQLWVELGLPLGTIVLVSLLVAFVQARRRAWACDGDLGVAKRAAFMLVLMIGLHSLLEYPLWYAYFLLPTAFAWGFALAMPSGVSAVRATVTAREQTARAPRTHRMLVLGGIAMTLCAAVAVLDYWRVVVIYDPPEHAASLEERIERGQRSPLFGHHADYAAATAFGEPKAPLSQSQQLAFRRAPHQLLDVRLMIAWSQALAAQGEMDKARWLAARIREFRNPGADEFFEPCQQPEQAALAFQCQPPPRVVNWREFLDPR